MIKVGILGYGGIARSHRRGYEILAKQGAPVELVALCDIDPNQFSGNMTINLGGTDCDKTKTYRTYTDLEEMLAKEEPDTIDICLPTYLHCEYACMLLKRGYNVQSEKPMGLNGKECEMMLAAAKESGKKLMIGMCLRFEPLYTELKKMIDDGRFGKVHAASFDRLSGLPRWGYDNWFRDYKRAGGVALDMHIHDVDLMNYLFGLPKSVRSVGTQDKGELENVGKDQRHGEGHKLRQDRAVAHIHLETAFFPDTGQWQHSFCKITLHILYREKCK